MIRRDMPMALFLSKNNVIKITIDLGFRTLDGKEFFDLLTMVQKYGYYIEIKPIDQSKEISFTELFNKLEAFCK